MAHFVGAVMAEFFPLSLFDIKCSLLKAENLVIAIRSLSLTSVLEKSLIQRRDARTYCFFAIYIQQYTDMSVYIY